MCWICNYFLAVSSVLHGNFVVKIKDSDAIEEEPVSRWHKAKKKKKKKDANQNRTTNNWNSNEDHADEVIYANTGYSSNNNSATSADNSDNETVMLLMPSVKRLSLIHI